MEKVDVLVVGAGPTGLTLAADLNRRGIFAKLIEKNSSPTDKSKALGVQPGTLEALGDAFGEELSKKFIEFGKPARLAFLHVEEKEPVQIDLSVIKSKFNFILILDQSLTEKFLTEELRKRGGQVERNLELKSFTQSVDGVVCEIADAEGNIQQVKAKFIVGCDGAHSVVRKAAGIQFVGEQYEGEFVLGDLEVQWSFSYTDIHAFMSSEGIMACFPMNGARRFRFIMVPKFSIPLSEPIRLEEFTAMAKRLIHAEINLSHPTWMTKFRLHHRLAEKFFNQRAILAGDAAHIHTPIGGQGMNTGIQDALNLADKLQKSFNNNESSEPFFDYEDERMPVARNIVQGTDRIFRLGISSESKLFRFFRRNILPKIVGNRFIQNRVIQKVSQIQVARKEMALRRRSS